MCCLFPLDCAKSWVEGDVGVVSLQEAWSPGLEVGCWTATVGEEKLVGRMLSHCNIPS